MRFRTGGFYIHRDSLGTFIWVSKVQYSDSKRVKLKANWCIQGTANWWFGSNTMSITIDSSQFGNWLNYELINNAKGMD